jgi:hypothetical protein
MQLGSLSVAELSIAATRRSKPGGSTIQQSLQAAWVNAACIRWKRGRESRGRNVNRLTGAFAPKID